MHDTGTSVFVSAPDGLRLHARDYGSRSGTALPVVCLPGLTRTVADFEVLAPVLAVNGPRRVIALDSRGRGQSEYDRNPENYNLLVELGDLVAVLTALAVGPAIFIGSSRGGLLAMHLAVAHPMAIAGIVLHDIGPVIEPKGLARLRSYVGKLPQPRTFAEGADILQFPSLTADQWLADAHRVWQLRDGAMALTYDKRLSRTLTTIDIERPLPPLWNEFEAFKRVPLLVIHGAKSDILSAQTVASMAARHPAMDVIEVADQGHVPLLEGEGTMRGLGEFVAKCDKASGRPIGEQGVGKSPA